MLWFLLPHFTLAVDFHGSYGLDTGTTPKYIIQHGATYTADVACRNVLLQYDQLLKYKFELYVNCKNQKSCEVYLSLYSLTGSQKTNYITGRVLTYKSTACYNVTLMYNGTCLVAICMERLPV